jgi:hypothetical protein
MNEFSLALDEKTEIAANMLNELFRIPFFSIMTLDALLKGINATRDNKDAYDFLRTMHCVQWDDMPLSVRRKVYEAIMMVIAAQPYPVPSSLVSRRIDGDSPFEDSPVIGQLVLDPSKHDKPASMPLSILDRVIAFLHIK